jgi:CRISPR/Cas system endoribonuclease Cas6 (RAMP superfamily)
MRFKISLHPEGERLKLPYTYNHALAAAIYSFLAQGDITFSQFLHQQGFYHEGKAFKLFTLSPLLGKRRKAIKDGLLMGGRIDWFISSPREEFVTRLAHGILAR